MYLYTESHMLTVYVLGILNGIMAVYVMSELKNGYRITRILLRYALKPVIKMIKRKMRQKEKYPLQQQRVPSNTKLNI